MWARPPIWRRACRVSPRQIRSSSPNYLAEASQIIAATDERRDEADLHRVRGDLLLATGDQAAAEQSYHQALAVAQGQSASFSSCVPPPASLASGMIRASAPQPRDLLAPIYGWFTEGFDTPVLQDAKTLLDELA